MMYPLTVSLSVTNHDQHLKLLSILGEPKVEVSAPDETPAPAPKKRARKAQPVKSADSKEARHVEAAAKLLEEAQDILKEAAQLSGLPKCKEVFASVGVDRLGNIADNAEKLTELINALAPFAREAD